MQGESILHIFSLSKLKENLTELHIIVRTTGLNLLLPSRFPECSGMPSLVDTRYHILPPTTTGDTTPYPKFQSTPTGSWTRPSPNWTGRGSANYSRLWTMAPTRTGWITTSSSFLRGVAGCQPDTQMRRQIKVVQAAV